jgi:dTDP-4-dehydrorhamnose reductase
MVGRAVVSHCIDRGEDVAGFDHHALDITDESSLKAAFERFQPDVVMNCAAWTDVDRCEADPERAEKVNSRGPELLALASRKSNARLISISTDYVFDGEKEDFYDQRDQPNPQSVYALAKLNGERRALEAWANTVVVRSGYIFGVGGRNFLSTLIPRARRSEIIGAISDSFGTPTYAAHLARQLYELARIEIPGIYHIVNAGNGTSFEGFARHALEAAGLNSGLVKAVSLAELKRPAARPRNSRLRCLLSEAAGLTPLPSWADAVAEFVESENLAASADANPGSI